MSFLNISRAARIALMAFGLIVVGVMTADARGGRGSSFGSRGARTFAKPPPTATAPKATQPVTRSATQPGAATAARPGVAATAGSRFGGGFGGMLMGGLIGAGLFGLLTGHGLFGGMTGLASFLGLLLQIGLIAGAVYLVMGFLRGRAQPAGAGAGMQRSASGPTPPPPGSGMGMGSGLGAGLGRGAAMASADVPQGAIEVVKDDYDAFEALLGRIQDAYGRESLGELRGMLTPEMLGYFTEEIEGNQRNNVHNLVSDAKLLQGDLAEAWSEPDAEYATVAMRYSLLDSTVERGTGRIIKGSGDVPEEVAELWTFRRPPGGSAHTWKLSAIQQTA